MSKKAEKQEAVKAKLPKNAKLAAIIASATEDLPALVAESEARILEAWDQAAEEAVENETKPKFRLGYSITLDLDANKMETRLSFGVRHSVSVDRDIPDPNQPELGKLEKE